VRTQKAHRKIKRLAFITLLAWLPMLSSTETPPTLSRKVPLVFISLAALYGQAL